MAIAGADLETEPPIERGRGIEVAHRVDDMVETAGHRIAFGQRSLRRGGPDRYFIGENEVGCRNAE
jgi:hypothetical protein